MSGCDLQAGSRPPGPPRAPPRAAFCARIQREGVECRFFGQTRPYLFLGDHKYWTMTGCAEIDLDRDDYVVNRARLYRDRRDFDVRPGDRGVRDG